MSRGRFLLLSCAVAVDCGGSGVIVVSPPAWGATQYITWSVHHMVSTSHGQHIDHVSQAAVFTLWDCERTTSLSWCWCSGADPWGCHTNLPLGVLGHVLEVRRPGACEDGPVGDIIISPWFK